MAKRNLPRSSLSLSLSLSAIAERTSNRVEHETQYALSTHELKQLDSELEALIQQINPQLPADIISKKDEKIQIII